MPRGFISETRISCMEVTAVCIFFGVEGRGRGFFSWGLVLFGPLWCIGGSNETRQDAPNVFSGKGTVFPKCGSQSGSSFHEFFWKLFILLKIWWRMLLACTVLVKIQVVLVRVRKQVQDQPQERRSVVQMPRFRCLPCSGKGRQAFTAYCGEKSRSQSGSLLQYHLKIVWRTLQARVVSGCKFVVEVCWHVKIYRRAKGKLISGIFNP